MNVLAVNARIGDGCLKASNVNYGAMFNGKNVQWVSYKRDLAIKLGYKASQLAPAYSGYKNEWSLVQFRVRVDERLTYVAEKPLEEVLESLTKIDLIHWFIDDGSWHKTRKTMHLYCNMLNDEELEVLSDRIEELYGIRPRKRVDRKKDGRAYNYLYFPRTLVEIFKIDVREFLVKHELDTLYYKVGETSETIHME